MICFAQILVDGEWITVAQGDEGPDFYHYCLEYPSYRNFSKRVLDSNGKAMYR